MKTIHVFWYKPNSYYAYADEFFGSRDLGAMNINTQREVEAESISLLRDGAGVVVYHFQNQRFRLERKDYTFPTASPACSNTPLVHSFNKANGYTKADLEFSGYGEDL